MAVKKALHQRGAGTQTQGSDQNGTDEGADDDLDDIDDALDELLEDDELDEDGEEQSGDEDGEDGEDEESAADALFTRIEALIDRRITGLVRTMDRKYGKPTDAQQQQARQRRTDQQQQNQQPAEPVVNEREARLAYKEFIGDRIKFQSAEERAAASELALGLIAAEIAKGADNEDEIGEVVAEKVATRILGLRRHYDTRTKAQLRTQGLLPEQRTQRGTAARTSAPQVKSEYGKGSALARARHPRPA